MKKFLIAILMLFPFLLSACNFNKSPTISEVDTPSEITTPSKPSTPSTENPTPTPSEPETPTEKTDLDLFIDYVSALETLANSSSQKPVVDTINYLRCQNSSYSSFLWTSLVGAESAEFKESVNNAQLNYELKKEKFDTLLISCQSSDSEIKIDTIHMFATICGVFNPTPSSALALMYDLEKVKKDTPDLVGWAGDLCQMVGEMKTKNKTAGELLCATDSTFSCYDFDADVDGFNIATILKNSSDKDSKLTNAISNYYKQTRQQCYTAFYANCISPTLEIENEENNEELLFKRISENVLLQTWCNQNDIDFSTDRELFKDAITEFLNFFA